MGGNGVAGILVLCVGCSSTNDGAGELLVAGPAAAGTGRPGVLGGLGATEGSGTVAMTMFLC